MKKISLYLVIILILGAATAWLVTSNRTKTLEGEDQHFTLENTDRLHKIYLVDKDENEVVLEKQNGHWRVNDAFKAMPPKMALFLKTLERVKVYYPVPEAQHNNVVKALAAEAVKVELYEKDADRPFKTYYVGGPTKENTGTFMIMEVNGQVAETPYVTHIPGFDGFLTPRYDTDPVNWRDLGVFRYDINDIQSVRIAYHFVAEASFEIEVTGPDSVRIEPLDSTVAPPPGREAHQPWMVEYLSFFRNLNAEALVNDFSKKDSILGTPPFVTITVTDWEGRQRQAKLFYKEIDKRSKSQLTRQGDPQPYDLDRYWALINDGRDFVIVQDFVFGKLFRRYQEFFQEAGQEAALP